MERKFLEALKLFKALYLGIKTNMPRKKLLEWTEENLDKSPERILGNKLRFSKDPEHDKVLRKLGHESWETIVNNWVVKAPLSELHHCWACNLPVDPTSKTRSCNKHHDLNPCGVCGKPTKGKVCNDHLNYEECFYCGRYFDTNNSILYIYGNRLRGEYIVCSDCRSERETCKDCYQLYKKDEMTMVEGKGMICRHCLLFDYHQCSFCGRWFPDDRLKFPEEGPICRECIEAGMLKCKKCGEPIHGSFFIDRFYDPGNYHWECFNIDDDWDYDEWEDYE